MCTQCSMFGFKRKDDPLHRMYEHSIEVSDDLLDQYILLAEGWKTVAMPEERSGPKPGIIRMREEDGCAHDWVPAPEYSDTRHPRLKCNKCCRVGKEKSTGEIVSFVKEYADTLKRSQLHKSRLEAEPPCEHEWELAPQLATKGVHRYMCKECGWLGYKLGIRSQIKSHSVYSNDKVKGIHGLRKESDGKESESKEALIPTTEGDSTNVRDTDRREDSVVEQPYMRS